ncbi:hypothetical protein SUSAZ_09470 [Sulfolobus acidocaldarius SUSAZ]|nr:hypothetical protein SUSAZ_09470 [Sulfolobus acidocaldarius SUSAZ]
MNNSLGQVIKNFPGMLFKLIMTNEMKRQVEGFFGKKE